MTFTFSRALHLMRYGGKRCRPIPNYDGCSYEVKGLVLYRVFKDGSKEEVVDDSITGYEIMGNWEEVL